MGIWPPEIEQQWFEGLRPTHQLGRLLEAFSKAKRLDSSRLRLTRMSGVLNLEDTLEEVGPRRVGPLQKTDSLDRLESSPATFSKSRCSTEG